MNSGYLVTALRRLRCLAGSAPGAAPTDGHLLEHYVNHHEEAAFAALVERHGGLVWGVCRRVLDDSQDADDAFQATFLVLIHKAASLGGRGSLAGFLQGVAWRLSRRLKADAARRQARERRVEPGQALDGREQGTVSDLREVLDEELNGLPEKYRLPLVLCYLEGKTYAEAARQLGWANGTVCGRLARARNLLRRRLVRRGLDFGTAALAAALSPSAAAPAATTAAVVRMASLWALGTAVEGAVSMPVVCLAQGALKTLAASRLKKAAALLIVVGLLAAGGGWGAHRLLAAKSPQTERPEGPGPKPADARARTDYYGDPLPPGALARMGSLQFRQRGGQMLFAADGKTLLWVGPDLSILDLDLATGKQVRRRQTRLPPTPPMEAGVSLSAVSPNGKLLAGLWPGRESVYLFDADTGAEVRHFPVGHTLGCQFAPDAKTLATITWVDGRLAICLWDTATGERGQVFMHQLSMGGYDFSADGKRLASSDGGEAVFLWDTATGRQRRKCRAEARDVAFAPDGKLLATGDRRGVATLWDTDTLTRVATLKPSSAVGLSMGLAFSPDGKVLAQAGREGLVLWDVAGRRERQRLANLELSVRFTPDGKTLAGVGRTRIFLWDVASGRQLHDRPGHGSDVWSVAVSPDGRLAASADLAEPVLRLWDTATGRPLPHSISDKDRFRFCSFSADGKHLVAANTDGSLRLWDAAAGKQLRRFVIPALGDGRHWPDPLGCHLSADGKRLAAVSTLPEGGSPEQRSQITVWDAQTGRLVARRPFRGSLEARLSRTGDLVSVATRQGLILEDTVTGRERARIPGDLGHPVAFSPNGRLVAAGIHQSGEKPEDGYEMLGVRVAEMATGQELYHIDGDVAFVAFSTDGGVFVTADDKSLQVRDALTGDRLFQRAWPEDLAHGPTGAPIDSLALMHDGRAAVTGMPNGTILVWDLEPRKWSVNRAARELTDKDLAALWNDLIGPAPRAYRAIRTLVAVPAQAVACLGERLRPAAEVDPRRVERRIAELDSERFEEREAAARELREMGDQAEAALRRALKGTSSPEVRRRVEGLLASLRAVPPGETLRTLRAIHALERMGTPEALRILRKLAGGAPAARATRDARAALEYLDRGAASSP
jgi:RNA polymerase sigma factor (sigma-70 family)